MTVSRVVFDEIKNYTEVQFNEDVPLLDSELNELQKIVKFNLIDTYKKLFGSAVLGDDLRVVVNPALNTVTIKAGTFFHKGFQIRLHESFDLGSLTTPGGSRIDTIFVEYEDIVVDALDDNDILDPQVGSETSQRIKLDFTIRIAEGSSVPTPSSGKNFFQLATLNRLAATPAITEDQIEDDRDIVIHNYVVKELEVTKVSGFDVAIKSGHARHKKTDVYIEDSQPNLIIPSDSTRYIIIRSETPEVVATLPAEIHVPLAKVQTDSSEVVTVEDLREFIPLIYASSGEAAAAVLPPSPTPEFDASEEAGAGLASFTAGENIEQFKVVYPTLVGNEVKKASNASSVTTPSIAIAIQNWNTGNVGTFLSKGQITNTSWNFTLGKPIFLGTNGNLTQTPPSVFPSIIQIVAFPITSDTINFNPSLETVRN